jgi:alkanesulfonate monooxygenase SsuD/methylene tetrahydromethanopterin reductase-like flavin-dependent oxidoreductase (luciferase family)
LWYGIGRPESCAWAAENDANIVCRRPPAEVRRITDRYRSEWQALGKDEAQLPLMGVNRHIVVAPTSEQAREIARDAYRPWRRHMEKLWADHNVPFPLKASLPDEFDALQDHGDAIAGTPAEVRDYIAAEIAAAGINYYVCDFVFGTIGFDDARRSIRLFAEEVMPAFA